MGILPSSGNTSEDSVEYQKPNIETLKASDIIEMLGPVSCGSSDPSAAVGGGSSQNGGSSSFSSGGGLMKLH